MSRAADPHPDPKGPAPATGKLPPAPRPIIRPAPAVRAKALPAPPVTATAAATAGPSAAVDWTITVTSQVTATRQLSVKATTNANLTGSGLTLAIYNQDTGARLAACTTSACSGGSTGATSSLSVVTIPRDAGMHFVATLSTANDTAYPPAGVVASSGHTAPAWTVALTTGTTADRHLVLQAVSSYALTGTGYSLAIYDTTTGARLKACGTGAGLTQCNGNAGIGHYWTNIAFVPRATTTELSSRAHDYVALVVPDSPTFPDGAAIVTSNVITEPAWTVTLSQPVITSDRQVYFQAVANYDLAISNYTLAIYDTTTGVRVKACGFGLSQCNGNAGIGYYWTNLYFTPEAGTTDLSRQAQRYVAVVSGPGASYPPDNVAVESDPVFTNPWTVSLWVSVASDGRSFTLEAVANYSLAISRYTLAIYDVTTGERLSDCSASVQCNGNAGIGYYWDWVLRREVGWGDTYVAVVSDGSASYLPPNIAAMSGQVSPIPIGRGDPRETAGGCNPALIMACAAIAGDPIDLDTGSYFESATDLALPGRGVPLELSRTYDTRRADTAGRLGHGWTDSYDWRLTVDSGTGPTAGQVTVRQGNGSQTVFTPDGTGALRPPSRVMATLARNGNGTYTYVLRRTTTYTFDADGRLSAVRDRNGYVTSLDHDAQGRLSSVTEPAGRTLTFTYDGADRIRSVTDPLPRTVTYAYDAEGNLATVTDADSREWSFGYDAAHRLTTVTDPRGHVVTNTYDAEGRVSQQADRRGKITRFEYGTPAADGSRTTTVTHPRGNKDVYTYLNGQVRSIVRGAGSPQASTETRSYDPMTNGLLRLVDGNNNARTATYDRFGNRLTAVDALNRRTTWTYNAFNQPLTEVDPSNVTTTYTYDAAGNLLTTSRPLTGTSPLQRATYTNTFGDPAHPGDVTAVTNATGKVTTYGYDAHGNVESVTDPTGRTSRTRFNVVGWVVAKVSPAGNAPGGVPAEHTTSYSDFTGFGRPRSVTDPLGRTSTLDYDENQNPTDSTDADHRHTETRYDENDDPVLVVRPDGSTQATSYDDNGNVLSRTDGLGHATTYGYDALDRQTTVTDAGGRQTTRTYGKSGFVRTIVESGPGTSTLTTTNGYDAANQLKTITYSDGVTPGVSFTYDSLGRRKTMTDGTGTTTYVMDSLRRLTQVTNGAGKVVTYGYDSLLTDVTSITYPDGGVVTRDFDDAGRLTSVQDWLGSSPTTFGYDDDGNWDSVAYANGVTAARAFDRAGNLNGLTYTAGTSTLGSYGYTRTAAGLLATASPADGAPGGEQAYAYTENGRLASATGVVTGPVWAYDAADRLTRTPDGTAFEYDAVDQLTTSTPAGGGPPTTFAYDGRGNRTSSRRGSDPATGYGYDQRNQLTSVTTSTGERTDYAYDGEGLRTSKTPAGAASVGMTWDILGNGLPLLLTAGAVSYVYGPAGTPIKQIEGTTATFLHQDQLGSTGLLTDDVGAVSGTYAYDAYGTATHTGTASTALRFTGQYTDDETGFVYLRNRYYDPATGQFLTRDPLTALTRAPYAYAAGNPLFYTDPSGLFCWDWNASCVLENVHDGSGVVGAGAGLCTVIANPFSPICAGVALTAGTVSVATGTARYAMGDQGQGQLWMDAAATSADVAGFGFGLRAARLFRQSREIKAAAAGLPFLQRLWPNMEAFGLRVRGGAFWLGGSLIDALGFGWDVTDFINTIIGDLEEAC